jgi:membrane-bound lytic murein transglycosylase C
MKLHWGLIISLSCLLTACSQKPDNANGNTSKPNVSVSDPSTAHVHSMATQLAASQAHTHTMSSKKRYPFDSQIKHAALKYRMSESLVYAIAKTESSFQPKAISRSGAVGLMQIMPQRAGADVFQFVYNKSGHPSRQYLFNSQKNIDTGVAYLNLLQDRFLVKITNPLSRYYAMIASYNGGATTVLNVFGDDRDNAMNNINTLSPAQVLQQLIKDHPAKETREYLPKVLKHQQDFYLMT